MKKTKITILCENRSLITRNITGEHGFSALIETGEDTILMDTGQGMTLKSNAAALGVNLSDVRKLVISHGHYDHTGGMPDIFPPHPDIQLIAHPDIFTEKYSENQFQDQKTYAYIGIRHRKAYLESHFNTRFFLTDQLCTISDGVYFSGEVPRVTSFENPDPRLKIKQGAFYADDPLKDDASLLIETGSGPVILTGCAQSGIVNVIRHFEKHTGHKKFFAVIGGTHLGFLNSPDQLEKSMQAFEDYGFELIAVSHCTGNEAAAMCFNRFKDKFAFANAGWRAEF